MSHVADIGVRRIATKEVIHGDPTVELGTPGIAKRSAQADPAVPSGANATVAQTIPVDEGFVILHAGIRPVPTDLLPGGAVVGDPLYITEADNTLVDAAAALDVNGVIADGFVRFGRLEADEDPSAPDTHSLVNLDLRDTF